MVVGEDLGNNSTSPDLDNVSHVEWSSNNVGCPAGTMEVRTFEGDGAAPSFGETDFGGFRFSGLDQGFTFVIP